MKYQKCEFSGCNHKAVRKLGKHWVCDDCYKLARKRVRAFGKSAKFFFIEKVVERIGGCQMCIILPVKFK